MKIRDKYEVLEILGKGGNGIVYKVRELDTNRILAVKETKFSLEKRNGMAEQEARILQSCFHPSLPVVLDYFREAECYYMVMEYVEGITLKEYVQKHGRLPREKVLKFANKIGDVLLYLHNRKPLIVYGDLKPQNIMVTPEEEIRLIDFGTAKQEREGKCGCYASIGYAAPEQLKGKAADVRSDIYSFGALLHYLLTGEDPELPPYGRRDLRECDSALSVGICWAVNKCLKEEPEARYQSMKRVLFDLLHFTKKERKKRLLWQGKQAVQAFLFLVFAAFFYQTFENWQWGVTWQENRALIPTAAFLILGCLWRGIMLSGVRNGNRSYHPEKNIWKTDKQGMGLFVILFTLGLWGLGIGVNAKEVTDPLPVIIYDESGYKLLWRENQVNPLSGAFRLEIPQNCFEEGRQYEITVTLSEQNSEKISVRQFDVKTVKSSIEN